MRVTFTDWPLFLQKTVLVFALSFALIPLIGLKHDLPGLTYAALLVVLHIFVLVAYLYRVRFRDLDPNTRSLVARIVALLAVGYLLYAASDFNQGASRTTLAAQMLALSILHTVMLALLMVRVSYGVERSTRSQTTAEAADR